MHTSEIEAVVQKSIHLRLVKNSTSKWPPCPGHIILLGCLYTSGVNMQRGNCAGGHPPEAGKGQHKWMTPLPRPQQPRYPRLSVATHLVAPGQR